MFNVQCVYLYMQFDREIQAWAGTWYDYHLSWMHNAIWPNGDQKKANLIYVGHWIWSAEVLQQRLGNLTLRSKAGRTPSNWTPVLHTQLHLLLLPAFVEREVQASQFFARARARARRLVSVHARFKKFLDFITHFVRPYALHTRGSTLHTLFWETTIGWVDCH